jgi:phenylacetate-CoA ligase
MEETVEILETFSPRFAQTVIYTYPPFAKTLLDLAEQKGIPLRELRIAFRLAGEGYSEIFRSTLNRRMGRNEGDLSSVLSGYGATDFGSAGKETPLCAAIKRLLFENDLAEAVLGRREIPSLCQYDPGSHFLETDQEELVVSRYQAVPLVRYRTGDRGVLLGRLAAAGADPLALLEHRGMSCETVRPLPFVLVWGRIDGGVTFFGANVLVSQVKEVFESDPELARLFTGDFSLRKTEDDRLDPVLEILVEPRHGVDPDLGAAARLVARGLEERSTEFATVRKTQGDKALPRLVRAPSGFFAGHHKIRYVS